MVDAMTQYVVVKLGVYMVRRWVVEVRDERGEFAGYWS